MFKDLKNFFSKKEVKASTKPKQVVEKNTKKSSKSKPTPKKVSKK